MHSQSKNVKGKQVQGTFACGNPKRFSSNDVVRMPDDQHRKRKMTVSEGDDLETESERHVQTLLKQQVNTDMTITEQFSHHRTFTPASAHAPETEKLTGLHNYDHYKHILEMDSDVEYLRQCGLNDEEIAFKLKEDLKKQGKFTDVGGFGIDPLTKQGKLEEIKQKIRNKEKSLEVPDTFRDALELSRQAQDLEKSVALKHGGQSSVPKIITAQKKANNHPDDPINKIPEIMESLDPKPTRLPRRERRRVRKMNKRDSYYCQFIDSDESGEESKSLEGEFEVALTDKSDASNHVLTNPSLISSDDKEHESKDSKSLMSTAVSPSNCGIFDKSSEGEAAKLCINNNNTDIKTLTESTSGTIMKEISAPGVFLTREDISQNRKSLDEILAMEKFKDYEPGMPNKTVFVKNLPKQVSEQDLVALFGSYQQLHQPKIVFKLLTGRMKGQAFVTFPDELTAQRAIDEVNGYMLREKPVILVFGKKKS